MDKIPKLVGIVGAGQMGLGITQLLAAKKVPVLLTDVCSTALETAIPRMKASLEKFTKKKQLENCDIAEAMKRVKLEEGLGGFKDVDFVIEAASEDEKVKTQLFKECDKIAPPHTILATNTSSIPITLIGSATSRPGKVAA